MKNTVQIPEGYRQLKHGEIIKSGDYRAQIDDEGGASLLGFFLANSIGNKVRRWVVGGHWVLRCYIRKVS